MSDDRNDGWQSSAGATLNHSRRPRSRPASLPGDGVGPGRTSHHLADLEESSRPLGQAEQFADLRGRPVRALPPGVDLQTDEPSGVAVEAPPVAGIDPTVGQRSGEVPFDGPLPLGSTLDVLVVHEVRGGAAGLDQRLRRCGHRSSGASRYTVDEGHAQAW